MTLTYEFQFLDYEILNWITFAILAASLVFLVLGSLDQKKDVKELAKILFIVAIILLVWEIASVFIPSVVGDSPTSSETTNGFIYEFLLSIAIPNLLHIILAIIFILFGLKNINESGQIISLAGLFYLIAMFESLFVGTISTYSVWYNTEFIDSLQNVIEIMEWIMYISYLIAAVLLVVYAAKIKSKFLLIYGILTIVLGIIELLIFLEII